MSQDIRDGKDKADDVVSENNDNDNREQQGNVEREEEVNAESNTQDEMESEEEWLIDPTESSVGLYEKGEILKRQDIKLEGYSPFTEVFGEGDTIHEAVAIRSKFAPDISGMVHKLDFWVSLFNETLGGK